MLIYITVEVVLMYQTLHTLCIVWNPSAHSVNSYCTLANS